MNFQRVQRKNRKAISPVLATVILIAITLIAAVAIAGFVFGLFGTFTSTARVQASVTSCVIHGAAPGTGEDCNLVLTNSGNANVSPTGQCSVTYGGHTWSGTTATTALTAGTSGTYVCTSSGGATQVGATAGSQITGSVILGNGGNALFSATAS
jgi:flagellin-like protein